ncbi:MAG: hypothetical protein A2176_11105 [Spirochaetes bacterium RBG_13_51_14]|nr:MAG: hypothetical protein A2176_11105 [Spirochaetes bacterium RBG_13_51_14]
MNCNTIHKRFLEMDNRSRIPLSVRIHMLFCSRCRHDIALLNSMLETLKYDSPFVMDRDMSEKIMIEVFQSPVNYEHHISGLKWSVVGLIIVVSMFLIPFSNTFGWLRQYFGRGLELPVSIVLGLLLSIYSLAGIFSNLEELKKFFVNLPKKIH